MKKGLVMMLTVAFLATGVAYAQVNQKKEEKAKTECVKKADCPKKEDCKKSDCTKKEACKDAKTCTPAKKGACTNKK